MKAILVKHNATIKYFSTAAKALAFLQSQSHDGNVYDILMNVVSDLYIRENGGTNYYIKNNTEPSIFDAWTQDKEEYKEWEIKYITID